jgi:prolyl-tRNA synthetase
MPQSIGDRSLDNGVVEYKCRRTGEKQTVAIKEIIAMLKAKLGR